ncbi:hypothetical protein Gogos_021338, partial [Gossypium gossypioides]|nr:hypothetical protein [Gossypium gossypioides]
MRDLKESPFSLLVDEPTLLRMPWLLKGNGCTSYDTRWRKPHSVYSFASFLSIRVGLDGRLSAM